jgi:hypothetical protein
MIRQEAMPFQLDRPVFFRIPTFAGGRQYEAGDEFKWKELGVDSTKVQILYRERVIHHNAELEVQRKVGDGLEELDVDGLHAVVDNINSKVKLKTSSQADFERKKCKKSKIADKQRGLIRSWRRTNGHLETE